MFEALLILIVMVATVIGLFNSKNVKKSKKIHMVFLTHQIVLMVFMT